MNFPCEEVVRFWLFDTKYLMHSPFGRVEPQARRGGRIVPSPGLRPDPPAHRGRVKDRVNRTTSDSGSLRRSAEVGDGFRTEAPESSRKSSKRRVKRRPPSR